MPRELWTGRSYLPQRRQLGRFSSTALATTDSFESTRVVSSTFRLADTRIQRSLTSQRSVQRLCCCPRQPFLLATTRLFSRMKQNVVTLYSSIPHIYPYLHSQISSATRRNSSTKKTILSLLKRLSAFTNSAAT